MTYPTDWAFWGERPGSNRDKWDHDPPTGVQQPWA
jgi:hypothetical protein